MIETKDSKKLYKFYKKMTKMSVEHGKYRAITNGFVKFMMRKVFEGNDVQMGAGDSLGTICIRGKKLKPFIGEEGKICGALIDWGASRKIWAKKAAEKGISLDEYIKTHDDKFLVKHLNEHSDGVTYRFKWYKEMAKLVNKSLYRIDFYRANSREIPKRIRSGQKYIVLQRKIKHG